MKGAQTTLYFSKRYDSDLISLYYQVGRKVFVKVMKESLRVLVRADYEPKVAKSLEITPKLIEKGSEEDKSFSLVVSFASEKDTDILCLISKVKARRLSAFIKNAMRLLMGPYYILGCMLEGEERLNNAYLDRKLFFVSGGMVATVVAKQDKPRKVKKDKVKKESVQTPVFEETTNALNKTADSQPSIFGYDTQEEPLAILSESEKEGEPGLIDDDDILSILENM